MRSRLAIGLVLLVIAAGCGKKSNNPMNPGGGGGIQLSNGSMSATYNGSNWNATVLTATYSSWPILAVGANDAAARGISFAVNAVPNLPRTYTLANTIGMNYIVTDVLQFFQSSAAIAGSSGRITLTTLTSNRAVATFECVATATPGTPSTGSRTITNGTFDVTF